MHQQPQLLLLLLVWHLTLNQVLTLVHALLLLLRLSMCCFRPNVVSTQHCTGRAQHAPLMNSLRRYGQQQQ